MKRIAYDELVKWKNKYNRKPLIIHGARQVGKTWLMKEFGRKEFEDVVYINFEKDTIARNIFDGDYDVKRFFSAIRVLSKKNIDAESCLLIFDEIQECPRALSALKYFAEDSPEYYIVAAGSLLGISIHSGASFPVGKVDFLELYPMNFREFLIATEGEEFAGLLNVENAQLASVFSRKLKDCLRHFYFVGGMPEVVLTYIETDDMSEVRKVQRSLLTYYESDFSKHAPADQIPRIQMVWNSIPAQLAKENKKFIYGVIREGARAKDYELAIQWLMDYGLIYKSVRVKKPELPLIAYMDQTVFKLFMLDTGLLGAKADLASETVINGNSIFTEFKGALTEQYVANELKASGKELYYYSTENSSGEIDFLLQENDQIIPIEVKSEENLHAQSLRAFCKKFAPRMAIRSSMADYREEDWMTNVPLYMIGSFFTKRNSY